MNIAQTYHHWIIAIGESTGLPDSVLHIHAGLAVLAIARIAIRRSLGTFIPFAAVVAAEAANEIMDRLYCGSWNWPDTLSDVAYTLFWPLVISLAVRLRPALRRG